MSYRFENIKQYKRVAKWQDGSTRTCTRCAYEGVRRKKGAKVTAWIKYAGSKYSTPVGYCEGHIPGTLKEQLNN